MNDELEKYFEYLASQKGLSGNSIENYKKDLLKFSKYLESEKLSLENLQRYHFRGFLAELNNEKLAGTTINRILASVKGFIKYKIRFGYVDSADILEVESRKTKKMLPTFLFSDEVKRLMDFECLSMEDYRDRALFYLLLDSGVRVSEVVGLDIFDINGRNELKIRGKGNKERFVLYTDGCKKSLDVYMKKRLLLQSGRADKALFINSKGRRLTDRGVRFILYRRIVKISLKKNISPHSLRHTFATGLLRNGADIRSVQTLLGHTSLATTQVYTHLGLDELKDIHHKFHPHG